MLVVKLREEVAIAVRRSGSAAHGSPRAERCLHLGKTS